MRQRRLPRQWEAQARMAEMVGVVDDAVTGVRVVKGFGQERARARPGRSAPSGSLFGSPDAQPAPAGPADLDPAGDAADRSGRRPRHSAAGSAFDGTTSRSGRCSPSSTYLTQLAAPGPPDGERHRHRAAGAGRCRAGPRAARLAARRHREARRRRALPRRGRADQLRRRLVRLPALRAGARRLQPRDRRRARRSRSSAPRARASRRSGCCSRASTTSSRARSASTGSTSAT